METSLLLFREESLVPQGFSRQTQLRKGVSEEWPGPCILGTCGLPLPNTLQSESQMKVQLYCPRRL